MKPYPLVGLNHFTVPLATFVASSVVSPPPVKDYRNGAGNVTVAIEIASTWNIRGGSAVTFLQTGTNKKVVPGSLARTIRFEQVVEAVPSE